MSRFRNAVGISIAATIAIGTTLGATAHADTGTSANEGVNLVAGPLAGLFGPTLVLPTPVCGTSNVVPLQIANLTDEVQTGSVTIPQGLTENVFFVGGDTGDSSCVARNGTGWYGTKTETYTNNFIVQPQSVSTLWLSMGGSTYAEQLANRTFSIGGSPNGTTNAQWYDFTLIDGWANSFEDLTTQYDGTGGTDPATNTQGADTSGAFNLLSCTPQSTASITSILTPYNSGHANGPTYGPGDPICMGWVPAGEYVATSSITSTVLSGPAAPVTVNAAQYNETLGSVNAVLEVPGPYPVTQVQAFSAGGQPITLPTSPSAGGWWSTVTSTVQNSDGTVTDIMNVVVEGVPAWEETYLVTTLDAPESETDLSTTVPSETLITIPTGSDNVMSSSPTAWEQWANGGSSQSSTPAPAPTPVPGYSASITGLPAGIEGTASVVSSNGTSMMLSVDLTTTVPTSCSSSGVVNTLIFDSVTMPDGTTRNYGTPLSGLNRTLTVDLPSLNSQTGLPYAGTFTFDVSVTPASLNASCQAVPFGPQTSATLTITTPSSGSSTTEAPSTNTPAATTPVATTVTPTASDYSVSISSLPWATITGNVTSVSDGNATVALTMAPTEAAVDDVVTGQDSVMLTGVTTPTGVKPTNINLSADFWTGTPATGVVTLPIANASGTYYSGTYSYTLTFSNGNGGQDTATATITANPPGASS